MSLRILVIAEHVPRPRLNAGDRRFVALLELMARVHTVDFVVPQRTGTTPGVRKEDSQDLSQIGVRFRGEGWSALSKAFASGFYHLAFFECYRCYPLAADRVRQRLRGAMLVVDSVDVHFAREQAAAALGLPEGDHAEETREQELRVYRDADAVIAVTREDTAILKGAGGVERVYQIPIVLPRRPRGVADRAPAVVFVGGFQHRPNADAVLWFVQEVWPSVRAAVPTATFHIVGSNPPDEIRALASAEIEVTGQVPDVGPYLDRAAVSVAPLRYGGGMKGKVIEALASGVPLVTTSIGVQGIAVRSGEHALIADQPDDFASSVIDLLSNPSKAERLGANGQELAAVYSPERIAEDLERMMSDLVPEPRNWSLRAAWLAVQAKVMTRALLQTLRLRGR